MTPCISVYATRGTPVCIMSQAFVLTGMRWWYCEGWGVRPKVSLSLSISQKWLFISQKCISISQKCFYFSEMSLYLSEVFLYFSEMSISQKCLHFSEIYLYFSEMSLCFYGGAEADRVVGTHRVQGCSLSSMNIFLYRVLLGLAT